MTCYGSDYFPYAWIAIVPLNLFIISLYNRYLPKIGVLKMFMSIAATVVAINTFCAILIPQLKFLPFFLYVWKEIYIMLMFQQLWSVIHTTIQLKQAKYLYGLLFAFGGLGGMFGSMLPGFFAVSMGSINLLFLTIPVYILFGVAYFFLTRNSHVNVQNQPKATITNFSQGITTIFNSKYLSFILAIVLLMQVVTSLIYFQFNTSLEMTIPEQDLRTQYSGRVFGIINAVTMVLQLVGSFLLVHFLGLKRSHLCLPLFLCFNALGSLFVPTFPMISFAFITIKAFDFSLFGILKEMLYIPLSQEEKFQAKSIIDVFAYRSAKAVASCLILFLQTLGIVQITNYLSWGTLGLLLIWSVVVYKMFKLKDDPVKELE